MTRTKIKKALKICLGTHYPCSRYSCDDCPYGEVRKCIDTLHFDIQELINEQEQEIAQLKAENARLSEKLGQVLLAVDTSKEMTLCATIDEQRQQVVRDFAERLKTLSLPTYSDDGVNTGERVIFVKTIDELLKGYE